MALFLLETVVDNTGLVIAAVIPIVCLLVLYFAMQRALQRHTDHLRREFEERLNLAMQTRPPQPLPPTQEAPVPAAPSPAIFKPTAVDSPAPDREEIAPEMLLVIAAAVTAYLGKAVRIRSARMLYSHESFNAWSQQGRAVIQASHNLAQRGY